MADEVFCVVGGGTMGRGIALVAALGGYRVHLVDTTEALLAQSRAEIERTVDLARTRNIYTDEVAKAALERIALNTKLEVAARNATCVVEAVPESIELKTKTFAVLSAACSPDALLATNTSALSITEMAAVVTHPERVLGLHFFNPVHKMKLVEIVRGLETSDAAVERALEVTRRLGKEAVVINESPGFITTRMNALIGNEAFYMLQEGVASSTEIDRALKLGLNHPMGPFELVDLVGLDTRLSILQHLHRTLGDKYRPCPLLEKYVKAGRLGRKCGRGVYDYT